MASKKNSRTRQKKPPRDAEPQVQEEVETAEKRPKGRPRHPPGNALGARIDELAMTLFGSRTKMAQAANLVPSRLSETIRGLTHPTTTTLEKIAAACNLTVSDLLTDEAA